MKKLYTLIILSFLAMGFAQAQAQLFFSEYIEGAGGSKKALEIYNPNQATVDLDAYRVFYANNGGDWNVYHEFPAGASIAPGDVWVMVADEDYTGFFDIDEADEVLSYPSAVHFNGDDAVAVVYVTDTDTTILDLIGDPNTDPGSGWEVATVADATKDHTLVRKDAIVNGTDDWAASSGTTVENSQWIVHAVNEFSYLGSHIPFLVTSIAIAGESGATTITDQSGTLQISATIAPLYATNQTIEWSVDDPSLAYINEAGLLKAINNGAVNVTAASTDGSGISSDPLVITISDQTPVTPVTSITVTGTGNVSTITSDKGTLQMVATVLPAEADDPSVIWSVDDPEIATISGAGLLSAIKNGSVMVTATAADEYGAEGSLEIEVSGQYIAVADLTELRSMDPGDGDTYKVTGEVVLTYAHSNRNSKYVQDAAAGILIDDNSGIITTTYNAGDGITGLSGTLGEYGNVLQFIPVADPGAASSTGNTITPIVVTPAELNADQDMYESRVIKLESVTFDDADGSATFADGANYDLSDATETVVCRTSFTDSGLAGEVIPDSAHVTGISAEWYGTAQIFPRGTADIEELILYVPSDDASITDLLVDDESIAGFSPAQSSYNMELPFGTTDIPVVTVTTSSDSAEVTVTDATDLSGDEAARTSTVLITAEDEIATKTYTVLFSLADPSDDASITDLLVDGTTVTDFDVDVMTYNVTVAGGATSVPVVTAVATHDSAKVTVTDATSLDGTEAERTTTVLITAQDELATKTYTVIFNRPVGVGNMDAASIEIYPVPADDQLFVKSAESLTELRILSITGSTMQVRELYGEKSAQLNISELESGVYFLKLTGEAGIQIRRFVKN